MKAAVLRAACALAACSLAPACGDRGSEPGSARAPLDAPRAPAPVAAEFDARFEDVTAASGIAFVHSNGAFGQKLLPETMGSGAALFDYDADGKLDVFLVNGGPFPGHEQAGELPRCALWRNEGELRFSDASRASGADLALYGMGAAPADCDGDGDMDVYVTALGDNALLENRGGSFAEVAERAGVAGGRWTDAGGAQHPEWSTAALWLDAERDGDLDLFVANYCQWTEAGEIFTTLDGVHKAFTTPERYAGLPCRLYVNDGNGSFADESAAAGFTPHAGKALGAASWDFDGDGYEEIAVANDTRPNFLFQNRSAATGAPRFEECGVRLGIAYDENGRARAGMGIDVADVDGAGRALVAIGNFAAEPMSLYRWETGARFRSVASEAGVARLTVQPLSFGLGFFDADLDGWQDLLVVNGHIEPDIARFADGERHAQPPLLLRGLAQGRFEDASAAAGPDFGRALVGRGLVWGDLDADGDLDVLISANAQAPQLLANRAQERRARPWLRVELRGAGANTRAWGARVVLSAAGRVQLRVPRSGSSYLSQSDPTPVFGWPAGASAGTLTVQWPNGATRRVELEPGAQVLQLDER
jgi:hypothetical protein